MELRAALLDSLENLVASGKIEDAIDKALEKCVIDVLQDALKSYGDFGKAVKAAVQKSLEFHGDLDLPSYNETILQILRKQIDAHTQNVIQRSVAENMEKLLQPAPEEIRLSELVQKYIEQLRNEDGCGEITCGIQKDDRSGYVHIWLDEKEHAQQYSAAIRIDVTNKGEVYDLSFSDKSVEGKLFAGPFYGFERMLFQMRAAKTRIVIDDEDVCRSYGDY